MLISSFALLVTIADLILSIVPIISLPIAPLMLIMLLVMNLILGLNALPSLCEYTPNYLFHLHPTGQRILDKLGRRKCIKCSSGKTKEGIIFHRKPIEEALQYAKPSTLTADPKKNAFY